MPKVYRTPRYGRWSTPSAPLFDATKSPNRASYDGARSEPGPLTAWENHIAKANAESIAFRKRADKFVKKLANAPIVGGPKLVRKVSRSTIQAIDSISNPGEPRKDIEPSRRVAVKVAYSTRGKRLSPAMGKVLRDQLAAMPDVQGIQVYAALPPQGTRFYATKVKE